MGKVWKRMSKDKITMGLLAGILLFLLSFPLETLTGYLQGDTVSEKKEDTELYTDSDYRSQLEKRLEDMLSGVRGAGQVRVMVTFVDQGTRIAEKDVQSESSSEQEGDANGSKKEVFAKEEKTVTDSNQEPWISREILPEVSGIAVIAQGGGSSVVKSEINRILQALFGLPAHKIEVIEGNLKE